MPGAGAAGQRHSSTAGSLRGLPLGGNLDAPAFMPVRIGFLEASKPSQCRFDSYHRCHLRSISQPLVLPLELLDPLAQLRERLRGLAAVVGLIQGYVVRPAGLHKGSPQRGGWFPVRPAADPPTPRPPPTCLTG